MKRTMIILIGLLAITLIVVMTLIVNNNGIIVPLLRQYAVCFGDSPQRALSKIQGELMYEKHLTYTDQTVYTYRMKVLDKDADVSFYFLDNRTLYEVDISYTNMNDEQLKEMFVRAKECIEAVLKDNPNYYCDNIEYIKENEYSLSLGQRKGAISISYMIIAKDNNLTIICIDNE